MFALNAAGDTLYDNNRLRQSRVRKDCKRFMTTLCSLDVVRAATVDEKSFRRPRRFIPRILSIYKAYRFMYIHIITLTRRLVVFSQRKNRDRPRAGTESTRATRLRHCVNKLFICFPFRSLSDRTVSHTPLNARPSPRADLRHT